MKPPISYYGGKQKLASKIVKLIPEHKLYNEPFAGGLAILFAKEPSEMEVINDTNKELVNFYKVIQQHYIELEKRIKITLHSRTLHADARVVYNNPHLFDDIMRAWAVWVLSSQSFASQLDGTWGYDKSRNTATKKIINKARMFDESYAVRLQNAQIECADAVYIISSRDSDVAFHYCDPPYFNSDCGHYKGYSEADFTRLLDTLANIKGKFLLSSYPSDVLARYTKANGWYQIEIKQKVSVNKGSGGGKEKIEVLTANYPIE